MWERILMGLVLIGIAVAFGLFGIAAILFVIQFPTHEAILPVILLPIIIRIIIFFLYSGIIIPFTNS